MPSFSFWHRQILDIYPASVVIPQSFSPIRMRPPESSRQATGEHYLSIIITGVCFINMSIINFYAA